MIKASKTSSMNRNIYINPGINKLTMEHKVITYCPLGQDYGKVNIKTELELGDLSPDLLDFDDKIKTLAGEEFTREDLMVTWLNFLEQYKPKKIHITTYADSHFPCYMEIIKEYN